VIFLISECKRKRSSQSIDLPPFHGIGWTDFQDCCKSFIQAAEIDTIIEKIATGNHPARVDRMLPAPYTYRGNLKGSLGHRQPLATAALPQ
jgi:hypothetical protein